jgi:hypothetical protein
MSINCSRSMTSMMLAQRDLDVFERDGVFVHKWRIRDRHVGVLLEQLSGLPRDREGKVMEADGKTPRALHGAFAENVIFDRLTRLEVLLDPVERILQDRAYVYQFKINMKAAFNGDVWPWHQDYSFWAKEDEMPLPRALTAGIFLDDVTEFNGPMYFIRGSHRCGCYDEDTTHAGCVGPDSWAKHVGSSLSYQTDRGKVVKLATSLGMVAPKGGRGTIVFFDCNIVHASPPNISPMERKILFITYNSVSNVPRSFKRPEFLVNRNVTPLESIACSDLVERIPAPRTRSRAASS